MEFKTIELAYNALYDFRNPRPTGIRDLQTGDIIECLNIPNASRIPKIASCLPKDCLSYNDIQEPGMYFIIATGSYYKYFDGEKWWGNCRGWDVTQGVPNESGVKYEYLY